jgi:ElaA protein
VVAFLSGCFLFPFSGAPALFLAKLQAMNKEDITWRLKPFGRLAAEELYQAMRLRSRVFVVEQQCIYLDADGKDQEAFHLLGYLDGKMIAYARLFAPSKYFKEAAIGRIVVAEELRGQGAGKALMAESLEIARRMYGAGPVRIGAQKHLTAFYERFGFRAAGAEYLEDGIPHVEMLASLEQDG